MSRVIDLIPTDKLDDFRFMRMALEIDRAVDRFENDGGLIAEVPAFCCIIIAEHALDNKKPMVFIDGMCRLMRVFVREQQGKR